MKKIKNFFEKNVRLFVGILIGGVLVGGSVYAATVIGAGEVSYTNNSQTSVQSALDDLYAKANNMWCKSGYEKQNETSSGYACNKIEYYINCLNGENTSIPKSDNTYASYSCIIPDFNGRVINSTESGYTSTCRYGSLETAKIEDAVTAIGAYQFSGCDLLSAIMIPNSVTRIGDYAFRNNTSLEYVAIPNSVRTIGEYAFYNDTSLTSVNIPNSVTSIGDAAFYNCSSLSSVTYAGTTYTSKSALLSALQANGVSVGSWVFDNTSLSA